MNYLLSKGEVLTLIDSEQLEAVSVQTGRVWLTRQDDPRDYCLAAGARLACGGARLVVIEALEDAALAVSLSGHELPRTARLTLALSCHAPT